MSLTAFNGSLARLGAKLQADSAVVRALVRFGRWWRGQLAECAAPLAARRSGGGRRLRVELGDGGMRFFLRSPGGDAPVGEGTGRAVGAAEPDPALAAALAKLKALPVDVVAPRSAGLRLAASLPAAAAENLAEVVAFEMDRFTPHRADEVYFRHRPRPAPPGAARIEVDLVLARRAAVDPALGTLRAWGLEPERLLLAGAEDDGEASNLLPAAPDRRWTTGRLTAAAALVAAALLSAAAWASLQARLGALEAVEAEVAVARAEAAVADRLRQEIAELERRLAFAPERKAARRPTVEALDELTRLLPDDAYLTRLALNGESLELAGYAENAARLIALFESSAGFSQATFSAPLSFDADARKERFNLRATVGAGGAE